MFGFLKKILPKKSTTNKYDEVAVRYVISSILASTVDRETLRELLNDDIEPLFERSVINRIYLDLNIMDKKIDNAEMKKWMKILNSIQFED